MKEEIMENEEEVEELEGITEYTVNPRHSDPEIESLINRLKKGRIYVPDYQRHYIWKRPTASKLVESVLLGFPIPPIYLDDISTIY